MTEPGDPTAAGPSQPSAPGAGAGFAAIPALIGEYRIVRRLGEGGMGVVYEAEQQNPRRRVALKVIRAAQLGDELRVRMFQREAETLGRLKHPDIAAVYESGRTEDGQHFLAMELAPGETLDAYLATRPRTLDRDELAFRLRLISRIADAAHYAHQRGVIHRDLKPANVIVTAAEVSGAPGIKILDFGIARVYDSDSATTLGTVDGLVKGTLAYMSPEQARGESAVDVRTDVYAIGVIAYETLAGVRPYDAGGSLLTALKVICDTPPRRLAEVWPGPAPLDPDVDVIVNKALAKVADERYTSAAALADDVRRYLASEPILARAPTLRYQLRKLVARNKRPFAAAAAVVVIIAGLAVGMSVLYARSQQNLNRALVAEKESSQNFALARGAVDRYLTRVADSPELKARGLEVLRKQLLDTAREFYVKLTKTQAGTTASHTTAMDLGRALNRVADISRTMGEGKKAEEFYLQAIAVHEAERRAHPEDADVAGALGSSVADVALVRFEAGDNARAEESFVRAIALSAEAAAHQPDNVSWRIQQSNIFDNHAQLFERTKRLEDAERSYRQAQAIREQLLASAPTDVDYLHWVLMSDVNLGALYARTNRLAEAETELGKGGAIGERLMATGDLPPDVQHAIAANWGNLGGVHMLQNRFDDSAADYQKELPIRERLGADHPTIRDYQLQLGSAYVNLGELDVRQKRFDTGAPWLDKAIVVLDGVVTREPQYQVARYYLSYAWSWKARALEGLAKFKDAVAAWQSAITFDDRHDPELQAGLAAARRR